MAKARGDFSDILVKKQILSADQVQEAMSVAQTGSTKLPEALIKLGYCTPEEINKAIAEHSGLKLVDLTGVTIPASIIEMVPESVARERIVIPLELENDVLKIAIHDPSDEQTLNNVQFILA